MLAEEMQAIISHCYGHALSLAVVYSYHEAIRVCNDECWDA